MFYEGGVGYARSLSLVWSFSILGETILRRTLGNMRGVRYQNPMFALTAREGDTEMFILRDRRREK